MVFVGRRTSAEEGVLGLRSIDWSTRGSLGGIGVVCRNGVSWLNGLIGGIYGLLRRRNGRSGVTTGIRVIGIVPGRHVGSGRNIGAIRIGVSLVHHGAALRVPAISGVRHRRLLRLLKAGVAVAAIRTATGRSVTLRLLLGLIRTGGTIISLGASSWVPWGVIETITRGVGIIPKGWFSRAMMLPRLVSLGVAILDCRRVRSRSRGTVSGISRGDDTSAAVARGLRAAFPIPSSRVGLEILDHGLRTKGCHVLATEPGKKRRMARPGSGSARR